QDNIATSIHMFIIVHISCYHLFIQSFPTRRSSDLRHFTPASANATLPLVSRIVDDLMTLHPQWRQAVSAFALEQDAATTEETERSEEHTSELQSRENIVCRLLLEKKKLYL